MSAKQPIYKGRGIEGVCILAGLVGYDVPVEDANLLTSAQLSELEVWAERTHLRASDNIVRVPARPAWLPGDPWQGPKDNWGRGPTPVDCAAVAASQKSAFQRPKLIALVYRAGKGCSRQYPFATAEELQAWASRHPYRNEMLKVCANVEDKLVDGVWMPAAKAADYLRQVGAAAT